MHLKTPVESFYPLSFSFQEMMDMTGHGSKKRVEKAKMISTIEPFNVIQKFNVIQ